MADGGVLREEAGETVEIGPLLQAMQPELLRLDAVQIPERDHGARALEVCQQVHLRPEVFVLVMADAQFAARLADGVACRRVLLEEDMQVGVQEGPVIWVQQFLCPKHRGGLVDFLWEVTELPWYGELERHGIAGEIPAEIEMLVETVEFMKNVLRERGGDCNVSVIHGRILSGSKG